MSYVSPAKIYQDHFVPALFGQWGTRLVSQVQVRPGMRILDVGCGTGVLALAAADVTGDSNTSAVDINEDMLQIARQLRGDIDWRCAPAEALPFQDTSFDAVLSQFALMFFNPQTVALKEMWRVVKPGGTLGVTVCDTVHRSPGYAVFAELLLQLFGPAIAESFRVPFSSGDIAYLKNLFRDAGIPNPQVQQQQGTVRFGSISDMIFTERACIFTLGGLLDDEQFQRLEAEAEVAFAPFLTDDGQVEFTMPVLTVLATKPVSI